LHLVVIADKFRVRWLPANCKGVISGRKRFKPGVVAFAILFIETIVGGRFALEQLIVELRRLWRF